MVSNISRNANEMKPKNNTYIDELLDMSNRSGSPNTDNCQSKIVQFFAGCNILVTGGSGFLGILLIEKLLRCCPNIGKMYMFMKAKKGKSAEQRFIEHFNDVIYDRLRKEQPNFSSKIIMIKADIKELDLGLSPKNRERLLDTNVIFHVAATVRFNETIRNAVNVNVKGTKQLLLLAKEMPNLKAFVHTSTAFSYCIHETIEEKFYPPPIESDKIIRLIDILDDEMLDKLTPLLIGQWPNTYAFTKAITEDIVRQYSTDIPTCIVRPSIITSTYNEPLAGWVNNIYGPTGIALSSGLGVLHTIHVIPEYVADIVPADYVISHIIAACWDIAKENDILLSIENENSKIQETERIPIYNYVSACQNPITWEMFVKLCEKYGLHTPSIHSLWYYSLFQNRYLFVHKICVILFHMIPAAIVDTMLFLIGRKPILWKTYKKIHTLSSLLIYFGTRQWQFRNNAVLKLWDNMNSVDRQIFNFNIDNLDWDLFAKNVFPGIRVYLAKDPMETIEAARTKYKKLKIVHYTCKTIAVTLLIWCYVSLILRIISVF